MPPPPSLPSERPAPERQAAKLAGKYRADFYDLLKKHDLKVEEFKKPKPTLNA